MKVKSTKRRKHRKHNPAKSHGTAPSTHRRRRRRNPAKATHHRRRRRRNPSTNMKELGIGALVVLGALGASGFVNSFAAKWLPVKYRGAASLGLGALAAIFMRKSDKAKLGGLVAMGAGAWDMLRQNVPALAAFSAEDAGFLLGSAATMDEGLARMLGVDNGDVRGVVPNVFGDYSNAEIPGTIPNVFGVDTGSIPLGVDTGSIPLGDDDDGEMFEKFWG